MAESTDDTYRARMKTNIREWLVGEGWQVSEGTRPDLNFVLVAELLPLLPGDVQSAAFL